jgi:hypothetical protein
MSNQVHCPPLSCKLDYSDLVTSPTWNFKKIFRSNTIVRGQHDGSGFRLTDVCFLGDFPLTGNLHQACLIYTKTEPRTFVCITLEKEDPYKSSFVCIGNVQLFVATTNVNIFEKFPEAFRGSFIHNRKSL